MGAVHLKRTSEYVDTIQTWQVIYHSASGGDTALLDVYVPMTGAMALQVQVGRPGEGITTALPTSGKVTTKLHVVGDEPGTETLGADLKVGLRVSSSSVQDYIGPRLLSLLAKVHGKALSS